MLSSLGVLPVIVSKYLVFTTHSTFRIGLLIKTVEDKMANGKWQMANGKWQHVTLLFLNRSLIGFGGVKPFDNVLEVFNRVGTPYWNAIENEARGAVEAVLSGFLYVSDYTVFHGLALGVLFALLCVDAKVQGGLLEEVDPEFVLVFEEDVMELPGLLR